MCCAASTQLPRDHDSTFESWSLGERHSVVSFYFSRGGGLAALSRFSLNRKFNTQLPCDHDSSFESPCFQECVKIIISFCCGSKRKVSVLLWSVSRVQWIIAHDVVCSPSTRVHRARPQLCTQAGPSSAIVMPRPVFIFLLSQRKVSVLLWRAIEMRA